MKKTELMERVREAHEKLTGALEGLSEEEATRTGLNPNWSIKDALSHISAWEIETVVNQHPEVLECGAHAVKSELGEDEVKVAIVTQPGASPSPESILDFCKGKMAHYAIPRYVEFVDALPKTETHRIQYAVLKAKGVTPETWDREAVGYKVEKV